jgi:flagellar hook-associated protein FlgK
MFVAKYSKFDLTCNTLYSNVNKFIDTLSKPFKLSVSQINDIRNKLMNLNKVKVKDVLFG